MNDVVEFLKEYIWKNGFNTLSENPFDVYKDMKGINLRDARLVLVTLMSKTHEMARKGCSTEAIVTHIQTEHFLNKKTAKEMASLYLELFSEDNKQAWNDAKETGFAEFCKKEWTIEWGGCCEWYAKHNASYLCNAKACLTFEVQDKRRLRRHLSSELKSNPFLASGDIYNILKKQISSDLNHDMEEYCNADDYYEPYLDEFVGEGTYESEKRWESWGVGNNGFYWFWIYRF